MLNPVRFAFWTLLDEAAQRRLCQTLERHLRRESEIGMKKENNTMSLFKKIDCISLPVTDIDAGIEFYKKLGHECIWREKNVAAGLRMSGSDSEIVIHTHQLPAETYFLVESVTDAIRQIENVGGKTEIGPIEIEAGLYARLRDPWNNPLVIMDLSKGTLKTDSNGNVIGNNSIN